MKKVVELLEFFLVETIIRNIFYIENIKKLLEAAGIDKTFTFYDLHHTHASLFLLDGINPKIVQERLGHSSIEMTLDIYSNLISASQDVVGRAVAAF